MAAKIFGGTFTMTGAAQNVATALALTADPSVGMSSHLTLQAAAGNAAPIYLSGLSTVTGATNAFLVLAPGASLGEFLEFKHVNLANIWVIGTAADRLYVLALQ
jgi:hypothetical protein